MSSVDEVIHNATILLRAGNKSEAKKVLSQIAKQDHKNAQVWYLLSQVADNQEQAVYCLNKVLELDPHNKPARMWLKSIESEKKERPVAPPPEKPQTNSVNLLPIVLLVILIVVIVGIVLWVSMGGFGLL